MNEPLGLIVSLAFAGVFFLMGVYAIRHRWHGRYVMWMLAASFVFALIGQPWVQTRVLPVLLSGRTSRGENADAFQQAVGKSEKHVAGQLSQIATQQVELAATQGRLSKLMEQVSSQQTAINSQRALISAQATDLTAQQERFGATQRALTDAQLELEVQRKKLADVESLIKNLYKRKRVDTFRRSDTNHVQLFQQGETAIAVVRLAEPAVNKSVDGYFGKSLTKPSSLTSIKNVVVAMFAAKTDNLPQEYSFTYTVNPNDTLFVGKVTITSNQVIIGSETVTLTQSGGETPLEDY